MKLLILLILFLDGIIVIAAPIFDFALLNPYRFYFQNFHIELRPVWVLFFIASFASYVFLLFYNLTRSFTNKTRLLVNISNGVLLLLISGFLSYQLFDSILMASMMSEFDLVLYNALMVDLKIVTIIVISVFLFILITGVHLVRKLYKLKRKVQLPIE